MQPKLFYRFFARCGAKKGGCAKKLFYKHCFIAGARGGPHPTHLSRTWIQLKLVMAGGYPMWQQGQVTIASSLELNPVKTGYGWRIPYVVTGTGS
jgi:hypothetical protein